MRRNAIIPYSRVVCLTLVLLWLCASAAHADAHTEARTHFEAGTTAFEQQRLGDAALEFERAYAIEPAWQVLYNLGTVYVALGRFAEAADALERYLQLADASVGPERRREVRLEIERQRAKSGWLDVHVNRSGADVRIDGHAVGVTPLSAATRVAVGLHSVEVRYEDQRFERHDVRVQAGKRTTLEVDLPRWPASAPAAVSSAPAPKERKADKPAPIGNTQRRIGWLFGVPGLLAAALGVAFVLVKPDDDTSLQERSTTRSAGFVLVGAGASLFLAGITSYVFAPSDPTPPSAAPAALRVSGWASANSAGLLLKRSWD